MSKNIHCIPVGGTEPVHQASPKCWCFPAIDLECSNLYAHNAKDCREKLERQGVSAGQDSRWVIVEELVS